MCSSDLRNKYLSLKKEARQLLSSAQDTESDEDTDDKAANLAYDFSGLKFGDACMFEAQDHISSPTEEACMAESSSPMIKLTLDSGCTQHTIDDENALENAVPYRSIIRTAKEGVVLESTSKGDLTLQTFTTKGKPVSLVLRNVVCIPKQDKKSPLSQIGRAHV